MRPKFEKGQELAAVELNALVQRVEALRVRARQRPQHAPMEAAVEAAGMQYGFELADVGGVLCVRRGWLWDGLGGLVPVGDGEWTELEDPGGAVDVWLDISWAQDGTMSGSVRVAARDAGVTSGRVHVRLGYRETGADGEQRTVQVAGGLVNPYQPVMARGSLRSGTDLVAGGSGAAMGRSDWQEAAGRNAGGACAQERGYAIDPFGHTMRNDFYMYYYCGQAVMDTRESVASAGSVQRVLRLDNTPWDAYNGQY